MSRLFRMLVAELGPMVPNPDLGETTYDSENRCRVCGEHIANPHAASCPADRDDDES